MIKEEIIRSGEVKIERVHMKELTEDEINHIIVPKVGDNKGKQIQINKDKTHSVTIMTDDNKWWQAGSMKIKPGHPCTLRKKIDEDYVNIYPGSVVSFKAKRNFSKDRSKEYNPTIKWKSFDLIKEGIKPETEWIYKQGESTDSAVAPSNTNTKHKYDPVGLMRGNSFNGAMSILKHNQKKATFDHVKDVAKKIFDVNKKLQEKHSDELGAVLGMCISEACNLTDDVDKVETLAEHLLTNIVTPLNDYLMNYTEVEEKSGPREPDPSTGEAPFDDNTPPF